MTQYEIYEGIIKEMGITSYQVSKATGISQASLSAWKKRNTSTSAENLKKIADFLGVDISVFLGETVNIDKDAVVGVLDWFDNVDDDMYVLIEMRKQLSVPDRDRMTDVLKAMFPGKFEKAKERIEGMIDENNG